MARQEEIAMRFYNPGSEIRQMLPYTNTTKDPRDGSTVSHHLLHAPEREFFELPDTITLVTIDGEATIPVGFSRIVKAQFASRGVVMVNPRAKNILEDDNLAANDKDAQVKGDRMWKEYLRAKASEWYAIVAEIKAGGGVPRAATGLFAFALKQLHMEDPADVVDTIIRAKEGQTSNADMQAQLAALQAQISRLQGAQEQQARTQATQAPQAPQQQKPATGTVK
jgi:hypothetical protein